MLVNKEFGKYLRLKRTKKGFSQKALADHLGYTSQFVHNWENGKSGPPLEAVREMVKLFKIPEKEILQKLSQIYLTQLKRLLD